MHRRMASFDMLTPAKEAELKENLWQIAKLEKAVQQVNHNPTPYTLHPTTWQSWRRCPNRSKSKQFAHAAAVMHLCRLLCVASTLDPQPCCRLPCVSDGPPWTIKPLADARNGQGRWTCLKGCGGRNWLYLGVRL